VLQSSVHLLQPGCVEVPDPGHELPGLGAQGLHPLADTTQSSVDKLDLVCVAVRELNAVLQVYEGSVEVVHDELLHVISVGPPVPGAPSEGGQHLHEGSQLVSQLTILITIRGTPVRILGTAVVGCCGGNCGCCCCCIGRFLKFPAIFKW